MIVLDVVVLHGGDSDGGDTTSCGLLFVMEFIHFGVKMVDLELILELYKKI